MKPAFKLCLFFYISIFITFLFSVSCTHSHLTEETNERFSILVFTKTKGFRHKSIPDAVKAMKKLGRENRFTVHHTEDAGYFTDENLKKHAAIVFIHTTLNVLQKPSEEAALMNYMKAGGGFLGVHAASDTEYLWPWYGNMIGAYFNSHPRIQKAKLVAVDTTHPATNFLPQTWKHTDEWYNFNKIPEEVNVLLKVDETSYQGGQHNNNHPVAWWKNYENGKMFYTALGHTKESWQERFFLKHILEGVFFVQAKNLDYSQVKARKEPLQISENDYKIEKLIDGLNDPVGIAPTYDGKIFIIERKGDIKIFDLKTQKIKTLSHINVQTTINKNGNRPKGKFGDIARECGLLGIALDPYFNQNGFIYVSYSPKEKSVNRLSRFIYRNKTINKKSELIILEYQTERNLSTCHEGGSIAFDKQGCLYLSTGDNTNPFESQGFTPIDEGQSEYNALRSSGNSNDLRGSIIKIKLEKEGSYTIPKGNLFKASNKTKPEIYIKGCRNPYRISIDSKSNYLYWGDVGPDSNKDDPLRGSKGYDEINQVRKAGFYGWPFFIAKNKPYINYHFQTKKSTNAFQINPINQSRFNSGLKQLPEAQPALFAYPYGEDAIFGAGGRCAMVGPVYYYDQTQKHRFPKQHDHSLLVYDWVRGFIKWVKLDKNENPIKIQEINHKFNHPIDLKIAPQGELFLLEYGSSWIDNDDGALCRISYAKDYLKTPLQASPAKVRALQLLEHNNCMSCHQIDKASIGPDYQLLSKHYQNKKGVLEQLINSIKNGSSGKWGTRAMPSHKHLNDQQLREMANYILKLKDMEGHSQ